MKGNTFPDHDQTTQSHRHWFGRVEVPVSQSGEPRDFLRRHHATCSTDDWKVHISTNI